MAGEWTKEWIEQGLDWETEEATMILKAKKLGKKIFKKGFKIGFNQGMLVATDYARTILFQDKAEFPLSPEEIKSIFETSDPTVIFKTWSLSQIMKMIKKYKKENGIVDE